MRGGRLEILCSNAAGLAGTAELPEIREVEPGLVIPVSRTTPDTGKSMESRLWREQSDDSECRAGRAAELSCHQASSQQEEIILFYEPIYQEREGRGVQSNLTERISVSLI